MKFSAFCWLPLRYMYPRYFLTHHFWTLQQRSEFAVMNLRDRLMHNRLVLRHLQSSMSTLKNDRHYERWRDILGKLGSGLHPTVEDIIRVEQLFSEPPYKIKSLGYTHVVSGDAFFSSSLFALTLTVYLSIRYRNIWLVCMASKRYSRENSDCSMRPEICITSIWQSNVRVERRHCQRKHYVIRVSSAV